MAKVIGKQFAEEKYLKPNDPPKLIKDSCSGGGNIVAAEVPGGSDTSSVPVMLGATDKVYYLYGSENYLACRTNYESRGCQVEHDGDVEIKWGSGTMPEVGNVQWDGNGKESGHRSLVIHGYVETEVRGTGVCRVYNGDLEELRGGAREFITNETEKILACSTEKIDPATLTGRWTESYSIGDPGDLISGVALDKNTRVSSANSQVSGYVNIDAYVGGSYYAYNPPYVNMDVTVCVEAYAGHSVERTVTFPTVHPGTRVTLEGTMPVSVTIYRYYGDRGEGQQGRLTFCVPRVRAYELRSKYVDGGFCNTMYDSDVWTFNEITNDVTVKYDCEQVTINRTEEPDSKYANTDLDVRATMTVPVPDSRVVVLTTDAGDVFNETKRVAECEILGWELCASSSEYGSIQYESRNLEGFVSGSVGLGGFKFVKFS